MRISDWSSDVCSSDLLEEMRTVTPAEAVAHPNWSMGAKISVDSATLMNKGLEQIEAFHLFPLGAEAFDVVGHPKSVIHRMIEYVADSFLPHHDAPDMRYPLSALLTWPDRKKTTLAPPDHVKVHRP